MNGDRKSTGTIVHPLTVLEDINVYLGRSNWTDPLYTGEFDEFRVYQGALLDSEVMAGYVAGPDQLPDLTPAPEMAVALDGGNIVISWPAAAQGLRSADQREARPAGQLVVDRANPGGIERSPAGDPADLRRRRLLSVAEELV
ncbi:MAG: hypothetical protein H7A46_15790 [Verrucomicrobiales bacterium]|nr:hypothetical protein [Verrucomicrobiales bacterium]